MIHITDFNGDIVDFISQSDGAVTEAEHMINVEDKLETFDFTILTSRTGNLQKRNRILITDKDGQYREFIIYNISSDLNGYTRVQTNASALEDIKTAKPVAPHKLDKHTVKQALEYALADTGWEVSDEAEWGGTRTTSWTGWHDRISILKQLETTYNMRVSFYVEVGSNKVAKRYVSLNKVEPLFKGEEIVYGDNMIDLKRTVDFSDIATALICLGPEDSETGKREIVEIKDDDAQAQFGLPYRYIWDIYEPQTNDENMTKQRLTTLGRTALNKRKQESISYEIDGIGLTASAGDMIRVKNEDFTPELYVDAEVVEVTTDLISGQSTYKFGVIKEYTRDDVYARFNAMLSSLRERLNKVVENTDSIISERLEEELKYVERYIEKSPTPPFNPKEGQLWLDTSHDGVAVLKRYENGEWIKSSVDNVKDIGGMTREETMYEALKERLVRNEVDYSEVFKRHGALVSEKHYHYVDENIKNDLTSRYNSLQQSYDDFKIAFNNINSEQPTIGLITTAISRAVEFEANLKEYNDSYYVARKSFDEVIALLQSQYSDEKYSELLNDIADSVGGIVNDDGSIDMSEANQKRLDEAMDLVAGAIGGEWNGSQLIADVLNREELDNLNQSIKQYLNGEINNLDGKLGKQIETVVNQAKDEFSVAIDSVDKKISGIEVGGRNLLRYSTQKYLQRPNSYCTGIVEEEGKRALLFDKTNNILYLGGRDSYLEKGKTYTFSFYAKASEELEFTRGIYINSGNSGFIPDTKITTDWERYSFTFTASSNDSVGIHMYPRINNNDGTYKSFYITDWQLEKGTVTTDVTPALEDVESDINNLSQEVTKNTTSLNVLENEITLKADSDTVKQILDDELEPIKSNVQSNQAELKVQSDLIGSKVDSATYEVDKDGIVKDIETNASAIKQTSNSLTSNIDSVNKRIDEQNSIIDTNKSSISQLNNQIALKVDSSTVKQMLDSELKAVKSNVQTNQSELKLLSNQISSKVEKSEYTTDINGITRDLRTAKSEREQMSNRINQMVSVEEYKKGTNNLLINSEKRNDWSGSSDYLRIEYSFVKPLENKETYTLTFKLDGEYQDIPKIAIYFTNPASNNSRVDVVDGYVTYTWTQKTNSTNLIIYKGINGSTSNNKDKDLSIMEAKLEKGSISTPYSKANEEIENILTKHETELNQAKDSISQRVSYTEINQTNKTLERVISKLLIDTRGISYTYDHNGLLQGFSLDRNYFKLNHNLIDINNGDVVIKDGVTTIKQAVINNGHIAELSFDKLKGGTARFGGKDHNGAFEVYDIEDNPIMKLDYEQAVASELSLGTLNVEQVNSPNVITTLDVDREYRVDRNLYAEYLEPTLIDEIDSTSSSDEDGSDVTVKEVWACATLTPCVNHLPKHINSSVTLNISGGVDDDELVIIGGFGGDSTTLMDIVFNDSLNYWYNFQLRSNTVPIRICSKRGANPTIFSTNVNSSGIQVFDCIYTIVRDVRLNGDNKVSRGIWASHASNIYVTNVIVEQFDIGLYLTEMARIYATAVSGANNQYGIRATTGSIVSGSGTAPSSAPTGKQGGMVNAGGAYTWGNWNYSSNSTKPPVTAPSKPKTTTKRWKTSSARVFYRNQPNNWTVSFMRDFAIQGRWDGYGFRDGAWFFGSAMRNELRGKKIKRIRVSIGRSAHSSQGYTGKRTFSLRLHNRSNKPASNNNTNPTFSSQVFRGSLAMGERKWFDVTSTFRTALSSGTWYGFGVKTDSTSQYEYMAMMQSLTVEVTYE